MNAITKQKLLSGDTVTLLNDAKDYIYLGLKHGNPNIACLGRVGLVGAMYVEMSLDSIKLKEWEIAGACVPSQR